MMFAPGPKDLVVGTWVLYSEVLGPGPRGHVLQSETSDVNIQDIGSLSPSLITSSLRGNRPRRPPYINHIISFFPSFFPSFFTI